MSSGVKLPASIVEEFNTFKMGKKLRYLSVIIKDGSFECERRLEKKEEDPNADTVVDLCNFLEEKITVNGKEKLQPRFVFFEHPVKNKDGNKVDKLFLIQYIPELCDVKNRMVYASSANIIKSIAEASCTYIQLCDIADLPDKLNE